MRGWFIACPHQKKSRKIMFINKNHSQCDILTDFGFKAPGRYSRLPGRYSRPRNETYGSVKYIFMITDFNRFNCKAIITGYICQLRIIEILLVEVLHLKCHKLFHILINFGQASFNYCNNSSSNIWIWIHELQTIVLLVIS